MISWIPLEMPVLPAVPAGMRALPLWVLQSCALFGVWTKAGSGLIRRGVTWWRLITRERRGFESCNRSRWREMDESKSGWMGDASPCQTGSWEHLLAQAKSVPGQPEGAGPPGRRWAAEGGRRCRVPPGLWLCAPESSRCTGRQCWSCGNGRRK